MRQPKRQWLYHAASRCNNTCDHTKRGSNIYSLGFAKAKIEDDCFEEIDDQMVQGTIHCQDEELMGKRLTLRFICQALQKQSIKTRLGNYDTFNEHGNYV